MRSPSEAAAPGLCVPFSPALIGQPQPASVLARAWTFST